MQVANVTASVTVAKKNPTIFNPVRSAIVVPNAVLRIIDKTF